MYTLPFTLGIFLACMFTFMQKNAWMFSLLTVYGSEKTVSVHSRMVK